MSTKDPSPVTILAARLQRAYPSLSPYSAASLAEDLAKIERAQRRHAERCCSGEDGGYVKTVRGEFHRRQDALDAKHGRAAPVRPVLVHDPVAEERAGRRIVSALTRWKTAVSHRLVPAGIGAPDGSFYREDMIRHASDLSSRIELHGDPRGPVLKIRLPGEDEATSV